MSDIGQVERTATRDEVIAEREGLHRILTAHGLTDPRVRADGSIIVHTDDGGYGPIIRATGEARELLGHHLKLVTDDTPAGHDAADAPRL